VRAASHDDLTALTAAVAQLLSELGGTPPSPSAMRDAALALLEDGDAGALLVADAQGTLVGVLAASLQTAMHVPGRYALIQDLWVHPSWRSRAIGAALLGALSQRMRELRIGRVEVGLPPESFPGLRATESFYGRNGFARLGPRMRLTID
jgi:branched-chain amino acid aminotransferase